MKNANAYLAPEDFVTELRHELGEISSEYDRLLISDKPPAKVYWAQNIWLEPQIIKFESISEAAKKLRDIQRNWACYSFTLHRRAKLIEEKLPHVSAKPIKFGDPLPSSPIGGWALIDKNTIIASGKTSSHFPNGVAKFVEDKETPPNRAYLKLWEAFTMIQKFPKNGEVCVDLGSSPGGWSWVLASTGAKVISIDKAPLDNKITRMKSIEFRKESAFGIKPETLGKIDWMCCDIACYPDRLYTLIQNWLKAGNCKNFICTIKFQGETDHEIIKKFAAIPDSKLMHLYHNKHELTWIRT